MVRRSVRPLHAPRKPRPERNLEPTEIPQPPAPKNVPSQYRPRTVSVPRDRGSEKQVRRGKVELSARFDLHGHTQNSAWTALPAFLARERSKGSRCVIVITGKGREGSGILRHNFLRWLEMPEARTLVSGYAQAHPRHGGAGAFYVFLRR